MIDSFHPNWASPPGQTISLLMKRCNLSAVDLANSLGITANEVTSLLAGITELTPEVAAKLSNVLGGSTEYWINRETQFRADAVTIPIDRRYKPDWLNTIPFAELVRLGWIENRSSNNERAAELLRFFGIHLSSQWRLRYAPGIVGRALRTSASHVTHHEALTAWLRQGEKMAAAIECRAWSPERFHERLHEARRLTKNKLPTSFIPELRKICADCGVALVIARTPAGCPASGAAQFLSKNKALLILSFRFKTDDQFWFSFFHEAGHLLLHDIDEVFVDEEIDGRTANREEKEANHFAADMLVGEGERKELLGLSSRAADIIRFAVRSGVSPGIVVGQLQYAGVLRYGQMQRLKRRFPESQIDAAANL